MTAQEVSTSLPQIVDRLARAIHPLTIYLFGSALTGDLGPDSDVDLLVVVDRSNQSFFERGAAAFRALRGVPVPIDVQVYTREEFESRASLPVSFERTVKATGRIIYAA